MNSEPRMATRLVMFAVAALSAVAGCGSPTEEDRIGTITLSVTAAPAGVRCLRVNVASPWGIDSKSFAVSEGATTMGSMSGLPLGPVNIQGEAFASTCSNVTSASIATWVSDPVSLTLVSGTVAAVTLIMRAPGRVGISVDWNTMGGLPTVAQLFPAGADGPLDGRLVSQPCGDSTMGTDCASAGAYFQGSLIACSGGALNVLHTYPVAGTAGATYRVTMHFYGIMSPKNYGAAVTREAGTGRPGNQDSGASPSSWATAPAGHVFPASDYDTYEIHVDNQNNQEVAVYYLNADISEGHWTYVINFAKQINVIGGGRVRVRTFDRNCRQIKNCGPPGSLYPCAAKANARIIDVSAANPAPPNAPATMGGLLQPNLTTNRDADNAGQWFLLDVVSVDSVL
jgi:hypothetical protein